MQPYRRCLAFIIQAFTLTTVPIVRKIYLLLSIVYVAYELIEPKGSFRLIRKLP